MITAITGALNRVLDEEVRLQAGPFEYAVLVPEFVRRQLQTRLGEELTLHTMQYLEGNQMSNRMVPRLVGFAAEDDLAFFELLCTVDKVGVKKALKALARPPREVADAIQREDVKWLSTLPGFGKATAETVMTALKRKVTKFALAARRRRTAPAAAGHGRDGDRGRLSGAAERRPQSRRTPGSGSTRCWPAARCSRRVEELLTAIYSKG